MRPSLDEIYGKKPSLDEIYSAPAATYTTPKLEEPVNDFIKGTADFITHPFVQLGLGAKNILSPSAEDTKSYTGLSGQEYDTPGYRNGVEQGGVETAKQVGGAGLQAASTVLPFLKGAGAVMASKPILSGLGLGYAQDVGANLEEGKTGLGTVTPGMNTVVGGGLGVAGKVLGKVLTPTAKLQEEALLGGLGEQMNRTNKARNAFSNNTITRTTDEGAKTITPIDTITSKEVAIPEINSTGGTAKADWTKGIEEMQKHYDDAAAKQASDLVASGKTFNKKEILTSAEQQIQQADISELAKTKVLKEIEDNIDALSTKYNDMIPANILDNERRFANREFKKNRIDSDRILGDTYRDAVANYTGVGRTNLDKMQEYVAALNFMNAIDGSIVKGGGLGRYFAQLIGSSVGSSVGLPGIGPIIGAAGGNAVAKGVQKLTFVSPTAESKAAIAKFIKKMGGSTKDIKNIEDIIPVTPKPVTPTVPKPEPVEKVKAVPATKTKPTGYGKGLGALVAAGVLTAEQASAASSPTPGQVGSMAQRIARILTAKGHEEYRRDNSDIVFGNEVGNVKNYDSEGNLVSEFEAGKQIYPPKKEVKETKPEAKPETKPEKNTTNTKDSKKPKVDTKSDKEYTIPGRTAKPKEKDLEELGAIIYGEISNRSLDKQILEARTIANIVLNRMENHEWKGKGVADIVLEHKKNAKYPAFQAKDGKQYRDYKTNNATDTSKLAAISKVIEEVRSGTLENKIGNDLMYAHMPGDTIRVFKDWNDMQKNLSKIKKL